MVFIETTLFTKRVYDYLTDEQYRAFQSLLLREPGIGDLIRSISMKKRNLFEELEQGLQEMKAHKSQKISLKTVSFKKKPKLKVDAELIRDTRERLNLSRAVFAMQFRVPLRTLEKWEQGATIPNDQAAALILMARKYPDTLDRLSDI